MQLALTVAGAAIGFAIPGAGLVGAAIGASVGAAVGAIYFGPEMPSFEGPRLSDLKIQTSTFGAPIPIVYGAYRLTGNIIYSTDIIETRTDQEVGGKGGGGATQTTYTYSVTCSIGVCEGPINRVNRIWANGKLVYDANTGLTDSDVGSLRFYNGTEEQEPDPFWQGVYGSDSVPAHRGLAYVTFENLQLATFGNRIPNFSFEVFSQGQEFWVSNIYPTNDYYDSWSLASDGNYFYIYGAYYVTETDTYNFLISKQDKSGNIVWSKTLDSELAIGISKFIYKNENLYAGAGSFTDFSYETIDGSVLSKVSTNGSLIWQIKFNSPHFEYYNFVFDVDNNDNVYIGNSFDGLDHNFTLTKLDSNQNIVFDKYYDILGNSNPAFFVSAEVMPNNTILNAYNLPYDLDFPETFEEKAILINTSLAGDVLWAKQIDEFYWKFQTNAFDSVGNIYCAGLKDGISFNVLLKINSSGNIVWKKSITNDNLDLQIVSVFVDKYNNIYVSFADYSYELSIAKFDANFNFLWSRKINNLFYVWLNQSTPFMTANENYIAISQWNPGVITSIVLSSNGDGVGTHTGYRYNFETSSVDEITFEYLENNIYVEDLEFSSSNVTIVSGNYGSNTISTLSGTLQDVTFENAVVTPIE